MTSLVLAARRRMSYALDIATRNSATQAASTLTNDPVITAEETRI